MTPEERFRNLLTHAWNQSPFYRELYSRHGIRKKDLPHVSLNDLPLVTKEDLIEAYDEAVTDKRLRKTDIEAWMIRDNDPRHLYLDDYIIISNLGQSACIPLKQEDWHHFTSSAVPYLLEEVRGLNRPLRSAFYFLLGGHYAGATNAAMASRYAHDALLLSVKDPVEEIRARLNAFQPERLYSYASSMAWLAEWTLEGKLQITPESVVITGERLTPYIRSTITQAWDAQIYDLYASTESLYMAIRQPDAETYEVLTDINLLEVVNASNQMVGTGERGRVLLTNLINRTLPLIRYELNDSAVMGKSGIAAVTLNKIDGKIHHSLPVKLMDGRTGKLDVHELLEMELQGVKRIRFVHYTPAHVKILYQSDRNLDLLITERFQRLLARKSAMLETIEVQRVDELLNQLATLKYSMVVQPDEPDLPLLSLSASAGANATCRIPQASLDKGFLSVGLTGSIGKTFRQVVAGHADKAALADESGCITYRELETLACRAADTLLAGKFDLTHPVAIYCGQQKEAIALILGVLLAGGFYLPLDASLPDVRLQKILVEMAPQCILTVKSYRDSVKALVKKKTTVLYPLEEPVPTAASEFRVRGSGLPGAGLPAGSENLEKNSTHRLIHSDPDEKACILYTSGTTGQPKGIVLGHNAILSRAARYMEDYGITPEDRISLLQSYTVSAGIRDIFGTLLAGASLYMYNVHAQGIGGLGSWLNRDRISILYAVPTLFQLFIETLTNEQFKTVRIVRLGGEPLQEKNLLGFRNHFNTKCLLANGYASTETGTVSQYFMDHATPIMAGRIPCGIPVPGVALTVQDHQGAPVKGDLGEITVDSTMLASGYWDSALEKIVPLPKPYATGDLGFQLENNVLFVKERKDLICKLHGIRIHLGEIETTIKNLAGVLEAVAVPVTRSDGDQTIGVYYIQGSNSEMTPAQIQRVAASHLPAPVVPAFFTPVPDLPRSAGGKVNRSLLPDQPFVFREPPEAEGVFQTDLERKLARIWQEVCNVPAVSHTTNLFDIGADSIVIFRILNRIRDQFAVDLPFTMVFECPLLSEMAEQVDSLIKSKP